MGATVEVENITSMAKDTGNAASSLQNAGSVPIDQRVAAAAVATTITKSIRNNPWTVALNATANGAKLAANLAAAQAAIATTGRRWVLEYLLSPVQRVADESLKER